MKRVLAILLCLMLLTGCGSTREASPVQTEPVAETQAPSLVSLYDSSSETEQQTGGAVRAYPMGEGAYLTLLSMGDGVLAVSADGILTAVRGQNGEVTATGIADLSRDWQPGHMIAWDQGVRYFAPESREIVTLDVHLQELQRIPLPAESQGDPVLQSSGQVFYCVGNEIRALDLKTGVSRLVRQHSYENQTLLGSFLEDTVIACRVSDGETEQVLYLLAQTGEVVRRDPENFVLQTCEDRYFAGAGTAPAQYTFGTVTGEPMSLHPLEDTVIGLPAMNAALGIAQTGESTVLACYDLLAGMRTAQVQLPQGQALTAAVSDGEAVWFMMEHTLYRWDVHMSETGEETSYSGPRYTAENPDVAGLAACQERVEQLRETYGLELYIWQEAAQATREQGTEPEYRVSVIQESLTAIEGILQTFPADFLETTGDTVFYLVQSLDSGAPGAQYWSGTTSCVVLDTSSPARTFLWGLGFGVDTRVLGNSRDFDTWDDLNPKGFQYTYDYEENNRRENADKYLNAFINQQAMSYPTEDRSFVFAYAVLPEGKELFEEKTLQKKLTRLCEGIREAYDLEDSPQVFPWEQYLDEPLAKEA